MHGGPQKRCAKRKIFIFFSLKDAIDRITPPGIQKIRKISNLAVMDVLYYTSPVFGAEVSFFDSNPTSL